jgi:hypothetical protein
MGRRFGIFARLLGAALAVLGCGASEARLYQWNDPRTGTTQLSGRPPAWYRKADADPIRLPRVFVFDNGTLIDDTHRRVSPEQHTALRTQAFSGGAGPTEITDSAATGSSDTSDDASGPPDREPAPAEATTAQEVGRLREILADWDRKQGERAKAILERLDDGAPDSDLEIP